MRPFFRCLTLLLACLGSVYAQETVNHRYAAKVIPFNLLDYMPGSCDLGQVFIRKDQTPGSNLYVCGISNDWHLIGGGSGADSGSYLFGFPLAFQGTPADGTALVYSSAAHSWTTVNIPVWKKYTVTYADAAKASATNSVPLLTLAGRQKICGLSIYVTTPFSAPTKTSAAISVGDSLSTATTYTAGTMSLDALSSHDYNVFGSIYPGNGVVEANITVTGALLNNLTAGVAEIDVCTITVP